MRAGLCALAGAVAAGFLATGALAAAAPALRADAAPDEIEAWIEAHVQPGGEMRGVSFDEAVEYYDPRKIEKLADGHLVVPFRMEYWRPQREGRITWRSERQRVELDCETSRARFLSIEGFSENNLRGRATPLEVDGDWMGPHAPDSVDGLEILQACSFATLVGTADWERAVPPPPADDADDAALDSWSTRHIDAGDYVLAASEPGAFYFFSPGDLERSGEGRIKVRLREEFALPTVLSATAMRSLLVTYEFDCEKRTYRTSDAVAFPGLNMLGTPHAEFGESEHWSMAVAGSVDARLGRALCRLATAPQTSPEEAREPESPPPPATMNVAGVQAWTDRYLNLNGYARISPNTVGMQSYSPTDLAELANGNVSILTRMEAYVPQTIGSLSIRSGLFLTEFDCRRPRNRVVSMVLYEGQNLEGTPHELEGTDWASFDQNPAGAALREQFCAQRQLLAPGIDRAQALIPSPRSEDPDDIADWLGWYIEPRDDIYAGHASGAAGFFSRADGERTPQEDIRVWTRLEFFESSVEDGQLSRSTRSLMDFDCEEGRMRVLTLEVYPGANLTGPKREMPAADPEWSYATPGSMGSILTSAVCRYDREGEDSGSPSDLARIDTESTL